MLEQPSARRVLLDPQARAIAIGPNVHPQSLTPDEIYGLAAYILFLNGIIAETDVMNATTLPKVKMPNRDNFVSAYPEPKRR